MMVARGNNSLRQGEKKRGEGEGESAYPAFSLREKLRQDLVGLSGAKLRRKREGGKGTVIINLKQTKAR